MFKDLFLILLFLELPLALSAQQIKNNPPMKNDLVSRSISESSTDESIAHAFNSFKEFCLGISQEICYENIILKNQLNSLDKQLGVALYLCHLGDMSELNEKKNNFNPCHWYFKKSRLNGDIKIKLMKNECERGNKQACSEI